MIEKYYPVMSFTAMKLSRYRDRDNFAYGFGHDSPEAAYAEGESLHKTFLKMEGIYNFHNAVTTKWVKQ